MSARLYRGLVALYPRDFRREYGDDLVQHFNDLTADRGRVAAWGRTAIDLCVTVPRYRLETVMSDQQSSAAVGVVIGVLAAAGVLSVIAGFAPGVVLLAVAVVVGIAQRGALAAAMRAPDSNLRRRRLACAGVCAAIFVLALVSYGRDISDDHISNASLMWHNVVGIAAMFAAVGFLLAGLLTRKTPPDQRGSIA